MAKAVLSVGQCGFDDSRIARVVAEELGAGVERAATTDEARQYLGGRQYELVLVNRVFDGTGESGVAFIGEVKKMPGSPPVMLVSDYAEAQAQAVANGAVAGFGKSGLGSPEVAELLRKAVAGASGGEGL